MLKHIMLAIVLVAFVAVPAQALDKGVYVIEGSTDHYYVDEFGSRHLVNDFDQARIRWLSDMPVTTIKSEVIDTLPLGDAITATVGPDMVVKKKTTTETVTDDGISRTQTKTVEESVK